MGSGHYLRPLLDFPLLHNLLTLLSLHGLFDFLGLLYLRVLNNFRNIFNLLCSLLHRIERHSLSLAIVSIEHV
jgi:hypothetical protein